MPLPTLEDLKRFARIDFTDDDETLAILLAGAIEYAEQATGQDFTSEPDEVPDRARIVILSLATHLYEAPTPVGGDLTARVIPLHVRSMLHQLRNWEDPAVTEANA